MDMKNWIVVDVEADNQSPASGSMVCFGAVLVEDTTKTFYGQTAPISDIYNEHALAVCGITREEHLAFEPPFLVMVAFRDWLISLFGTERITFISDNPAFDWQWINFYFDRHALKNPFGFSARRIGDIYCGIVKDLRANRDWKRKYRQTPHDHNPVNDAKGNAEALQAIYKKYL